MLYKIQGLFYRKNKLTTENILNELISFINILPEWNEKPEHWVLASQKGSINAITNGSASPELIEYLSEKIVSGTPISIVLADKNEDDSTLTLWVKNTPAISDKRYSLSFTMKSLYKLNDIDVFLKIFGELVSINQWEFKYILLDTEQYKRKQRSVFDDRLAVGWMLYLPELIASETVPSAYKIIQQKDKLGTIVISKETFDGNKDDDVHCANNVEIELSANGHLPLEKGL